MVHEGFAEQPLLLWIRPIIFAAGIALIWPLTTGWHLAMVALVTTLLLVNKLVRPNA